MPEINWKSIGESDLPILMCSCILSAGILSPVMGEIKNCSVTGGAGLITEKAKQNTLKNVFWKKKKTHK